MNKLTYWRSLDLPDEVRRMCEKYEPHAGELEGPATDQFKRDFVEYCNAHPEFDHAAVTPLFD